MNRNFDRALKLVLKHEGGFVNDSRDPGGATNKGITIGTFRRYVKKNGSVADLKNITDAQVAFVYRKHYWSAVNGDELPSGVDYAVFDFAVNSGPGRAIRYLQSVVGVEQDGILGPATMRAVKAKDASDVIEALCDARMRFLRDLKTWPVFKNGWTSRVTGVEDEALKMAKLPGSNTLPPKPPVVVEPKPDTKPNSVSPKPNSVWAMIAALFKMLMKGGK